MRTYRFGGRAGWGWWRAMDSIHFRYGSGSRDNQSLKGVEICGYFPWEVIALDSARSVCSG